MSQKYADIIIDISYEAIDRTFQYKIPASLQEAVKVGVPVLVPFGQGNRHRTGYVISVSDTPNYDVTKLKEISGISDKGLAIEANLILLADWIHVTYGSTMIQALKTVMPVKERVRKTAQKKENPEYALNREAVGTLTTKQQELVDEFATNLLLGQQKTYLLHGVTGSGKTEVYIGCIKEVIKQGKQAIVLIPEIGLTYQNVARFKQHFGERVAFIHSKQSKGEKYQEFMRAKNHEVDVVIGPRSALFTPCAKLGLIIVDEEHDMAYKSEQTPKYHARDVAIKRASLEGGSVILGSATPTIESYANAKLGNYILWELLERPDQMVLPEVSIVDLREELHMGNRSIISQKLRDSMEACLSRKEQIMLFINRRGYNSFVSCRDCGEAVKCPKCDVTLSLHNNGFMMCHYCGHIERKPSVCPKCKSTMIGGFGTGTEKVEEAIKGLFPGVRTLRMDKDTTGKKGSHGEILSDFLEHKADVLIGTQMIVKGHDFSNVTLVGIILADLSLFANDFRAGERTFDLLTQAAGRAGRGDKTGQVVIQTYQPEHYAILAASKHDYQGFFDMEMSYRRLMKYPPVYDMMVMLVLSPDYEQAKAASEALYKQIVERYQASAKFRVIGPSDATIGRINEIYRRVIYIKTDNRIALQEMNEIVEQFEWEKVSVTVDMNPVMTY